jgi:hypothetical protein
MSILESTIYSLPETLAEVAKAVGPVYAVQVARKLGGKRVYLTRTMYSAHPLAQAVGLQAAILIKATLGRDYWIVPTASYFLNWMDCRVLRKCGMKPGEIADRVGLTQRYVWKMLQDFDPNELEVSQLAVDIAKFYCVKNRLSGSSAVEQPSLPTSRQPPRPADRMDGQLDLGFRLAPRGMRLTDVEDPA